MSSESEQLYQEMTDISNKYGEGSSSAQQIIPSICRVPERLRKINPRAYTPRVVSIGPLHRHDELPQRLQENKKIYVHSLWERTAKATKCDVSEIRRRCVNAMLEVTPQARAFYGERFQDDDREFAKLMLIDGCFILEILYRSVIGDDKDNVINPLFINDLNKVTIEWDLLLLENQIPFPVLKHLFQLTLQNIVVKNEKLSLTKYVIGFLNTIAEQSEIRDVGGRDDETEYYHILDFLHKFYHPRTPDSPGDYPHLYYSASDLERAGVNFKPSESPDFFIVEFRSLFSLHVAGERPQTLPVTEPVTPKSCSRCLLFGLLNTLQRIISQFKCYLFDTHCLLLPLLRLYDDTETFLRNLIPHEQCSPNVPQFFTSYAILMDILIDSKEDVKLLVKKGVLINYLGANEEVANLFNNLCKQIFVQKFYYTKQWQELTNYRNLYWPKHIASLKRTYFGNPWSRISFCAALILFALTAIQNKS